MITDPRWVVVTLSDEGGQQFGRLFEASGRTAEVFVQYSDQQGLWVLEQSQNNQDIATLILVKWNYIESVMYEVAVAEPKRPQLIGFERTNTE